MSDLVVAKFCLLVVSQFHFKPNPLLPAGSLISVDEYEPPAQVTVFPNPTVHHVLLLCTMLKLKLFQTPDEGKVLRFAYKMLKYLAKILSARTIFPSALKTCEEGLLLKLDNSSSFSSKVPVHGKQLAP